MDENKVVSIYEVLDRAGVSALAKELLAVVNARINERIVTTIDESSDNNHVASALAVYQAIVKNSHIDMKTYTGRDINDIVDPSPTTIYLQRDDETDTTWTMYVHDEESGWIAIGDTAIDLSDYWSKGEADTDALKELLGITGINEDIATLQSQLDTKVDQSQMYALTASEIQAIIAQADEKTATQMVKVGNVVYSDMAAAIANCEEGGTVTLTKDIALQGKVTLTKDTTVDLNGKTMKVDAGTYAFSTDAAKLTLKNGTIQCSDKNKGIMVKQQGSAKLENVQMTGTNVTLVQIEQAGNVEIDADCVLETTNLGAVVVLDNGVVDVYGKVKSVGDVYAISGNNKYGIDTTINIHEGAVVESTGVDTPAIYHPGKGTLNITGGQIIAGATGIEMRAGVLNMSGGSIVANGNKLTEIGCKPNNSGTCTEGAGIAIIQHVTKYPITVNITGGIVESDLAAIFERNVHTNLPAPSINLGISGTAEINGPVSVENAANFISGGVFAPQPNEVYLADGKRFVEENGKFTVQDA